MSAPTEHDADLLADVLWWLKGYTAAAGATTPFPAEPGTEIGPEHFEALRKARLLILEGIPEKESGQ